MSEMYDIGPLGYKNKEEYHSYCLKDINIQLCAVGDKAQV